MVLFSMIQPLLQWAPISPICSAVGGAPGGGGVAHREAAHGDVVSAGFFRIEDRLPHIDLDPLYVRVDVLELGPDCRIGPVDLRIPKRGAGCLRLAALANQAQRFDAAGCFDPSLEGRPRLPPARVGDGAGAQQLAVGCVEADLDDRSLRGRRSADGDLLGTLAEINALIAEPIAMADPAEAFSAFGARGAAAALMGSERRGRDSLGAAVADGLQPLQIQQHRLLRRLRRGCRGCQQFVQLGRLDQPLAIEIDRAGVMIATIATEPVAVDQVVVGIEAAEEGVGKRHLPNIVLNLLPVLDDFRALDLHLLARRSLIGDALCVGLAAAWRVDALAIHTFVYRDDIARLREIRAALDRAKRQGLRAGVGVLTARGYMELGGVAGDQRRQQQWRGEGDENVRCSLVHHVFLIGICFSLTSWVAE